MENTVSVEQAVFTSVRSPMGNGYRLVTASSRLTFDEKREIVQRAPSHGSLCDEAPGAVALAAFSMQSGRRCVFRSRHAGVEQTARGGQRVYTHVLVLDAAAYRRFHCDPTVIDFVAASATAQPPASGSVCPPRLPALELSPPGSDTEAALATAATPGADTTRPLSGLLGAVLAGGQLLVGGVPSGAGLLRWLMWSIPAAVREQISLSVGLNFSPARCFRVVLTDSLPNGSLAAAQDLCVEVLGWKEAAGLPHHGYESWLGFVRQRWAAGRLADLRRLTNRMVCETAPEDLARIAGVCLDLDRVATADLSLLDELGMRHRSGSPVSDTHARLRTDLLRQAEQRRAKLEQSEAAAQPPGPLP